MGNLINLVSTVGAFALAATPLLAVGGAAHAQDAQPVRIKVADLDLARPADAAVFSRRVTVAAGSMCQTFGPVELSRRAGCERAVREEAYAQLRLLRPAGAPASAWTVAGR